MAENQSQLQLHALIRGRVQGVGFRFFVQRKAADLSLTGWVRNTPDGDVEVTAEGDEANLQVLLGSLYQGPRGSWVSSVDADWGKSSKSYPSFFVAQSSD